ncbi:MAG: DUF3990 domain-containing protein [Treponema sp.]|nr:DUF3990 domain-containing protein [Treponema sp.]
MILYHGSYTQIGIPKIIVQEKGRDFGFGFYTTSIKKQAERWAIRTARLRSHHSDKIANNNVGETIEYVLAGIMRKEDAVERLRFEKINEQICFCTEESLKAIAFKESYVVKNVFWRDI